MYQPMPETLPRGSESRVSTYELGQKIAQGNRREVYSVRGNPKLLIKLPSTIDAVRVRCAITRALKRFYRRHVPLRRELHEYRRVSIEPTSSHLQYCLGVAETSSGRGLVVLAVTRIDGTLAPTLRDLIANGEVNHTVISALMTFLDWMIATRLVVADVYTGNIVYDERQERLVLIDGIGDKTFIPIRAWIPLLNRLYKRKLAIRLLQGVTRQLRERQ